MKNNIEKLCGFHCPLWEELPSQPIFNQDLVTYVNEILEDLIDENEKLTKTMIQNYSKWEVIPKISGRKYSKEQISILIIILIYKQVLNIMDVKKGIELQLKLMPIEEGYNLFARTLEDAVHRVFTPAAKGKNLVLSDLVLEEKEEGVRLIAGTFALRLLVKKIIESDGYKNIGGKNE